MNATSSSFEFTNDEVAEDSHVVYQMKEEDRKVYFEELAERDAQVLKEAATYLDESQQEALKAQMDEDRSRTQKRAERRGGGSRGRGGFGRR